MFVCFFTFDLLIFCHSFILNTLVLQPVLKHWVWCGTTPCERDMYLFTHSLHRHPPTSFLVAGRKPRTWRKPNGGRECEIIIIFTEKKNKPQPQNLYVYEVNRCCSTWQQKKWNQLNQMSFFSIQKKSHAQVSQKLNFLNTEQSIKCLKKHIVSAMSIMNLSGEQWQLY